MSYEIKCFGGLIFVEKADIFRGCLIGGAIGDALGYTVEFEDWKEIKKRFGEEEIKDLVADEALAVAVYSVLKYKDKIVCWKLPRYRSWYMMNGQGIIDNCERAAFAALFDY